MSTEPDYAATRVCLLVGLQDLCRLPGLAEGGTGDSVVDRPGSGGDA
jgi:hypothetical protein